MKSLFTIVLATVAFGIFVSSLVRGGQFDQSYPVQTGIAGVVDVDAGSAGVIAASWRYDSHHRYYGGHYRRGDPFYGTRRHWYGVPYFYGSGYFYRPYYPYYPYRHYYPRYYSPYGGHFGFSVCFRSGGVQVCVNDSYPYRYR